MALPAIDNCNGAASTISSNWTRDLGNLVYNGSGQLHTFTSAFNLARWTADGFANDQYAQGVTNSGDYGAVATRLTASPSGYLHFGSAGASSLQRLDAGTGTVLQTLPLLSGTKTLRLESVGSVHRCFVSGVQVGTNVTDATYASGAGGVCCYNIGPELDDIELGNVGAVGGFQAARAAGSNVLLQPGVR